jgi:roadblock/LC7 domain-containing protein
MPGVRKTKEAKKAPLGSGGRFKKLKGELASKGAKDPGALAAYIGRKKYGPKKMADMAARGRAAKNMLKKRA